MLVFFSYFSEKLFFMFKIPVQKPIICRRKKPCGGSFQLLSVALVLSIFLPIYALAQPGYTISQPAWVNPPALTGGTNVNFTSQNDAVASVIIIPFYFRFYGNSYNQLFFDGKRWDLEQQ